MIHKTNAIRFSPSPKRPLIPAAGQVGFRLMSVFCFILILRNSDAAVAYMGRGLTLCAKTVIPSLFPFMVISELLVSSGAGEALGRLFSGIMRRVFGISGAGASAVFLGSICGFPVGAKTAVALYDKGVISRSECQHLFTFTSNPSSVFLITAVGVSLYDSRALGVTLYCVVLGCGLVTGFLARFFLRSPKEPPEHPHFPSGLHPNGVESFTGAVSSAATGMLTVCAYIIFFSALTGALECAVSGTGGGESIGYTLLCGFLEMTGGISQASILSGSRGVILTAAFAGWSGVSVHCQVMTLCGGRGLSWGPYLVAKGFQGLLCGVIMGVILRWFPSLMTPAEGVAGDTLPIFTPVNTQGWPALVTGGLFLIGWMIYGVERLKKN